MQRDKGYLVDILEAAKLATSYIRNKTQEDFFRDIQCQDAVIRRFEIIGEAARKVSDNTRARYPVVALASDDCDAEYYDPSI